MTNWPLFADGTPLRVWVKPNGDETYALSPVLLAIAHELELELEGGCEPTITAVDLRRREYLDGRRQPSHELLEEIGDYDYAQRLNGYVDEESGES